MAMARMPTYWTNKKCLPSLQAVSQLSLSQPPRGFPSTLKLLKNRQATQAISTLEVR